MQSDFRKVGGLSLAFLLVLLPVTMFAQGIATGVISGVVTDPQGAVLSGATITARNEGTNTESTTQSNSTGGFRITALPVGTYTVTIESANFTGRRSPAWS